MMFEELDTVTLTTGKLGLKKGSVGTVVYVYKDGREAEVEFMTDNGRTLKVLTIPVAELSKFKTNTASSFKTPKVQNEERSIFQFSTS